MKKIGRGWKTMNYYWNRNGIICALTNNSKNIIKEFKNLSSIKKQFQGENFNISCILDEHLTVFPFIFQIVIECNSNDQKNEILDILNNKKGLDYECILKYKWVDEIPSNILKSLLYINKIQ